MEITHVHTMNTCRFKVTEQTKTESTRMQYETNSHVQRAETKEEILGSLSEACNQPPTSSKIRLIVHVLIGWIMSSAQKAYESTCPVAC